jgi:hypothetical protein
MWGTSLLNTNDKFKFSHEIVNNVKFLVVANKKGEIFLANDYTYFRYSAAEVMGNGFGINGGFWIYSQSFTMMVSLKRTFNCQKMENTNTSSGVTKYSNDLIIRFGQDTNEVNSHKRYKTCRVSYRYYLRNRSRWQLYFYNQNSIKILGYNLTELSTKKICWFN